MYRSIMDFLKIREIPGSNIAFEVTDSLPALRVQRIRLSLNCWMLLYGYISANAILFCGFLVASIADSALADRLLPAGKTGGLSTGAESGM